MNKYKLISKLEAFAPLETQEKWDCSGWIIENNNENIDKVMFALTVTDEVYEQALNSGCDLIISHHPLFIVPLKFRNIQIYCAHTNLDKAYGGTTDTLLEQLNLKSSQTEYEFVRVVELSAPISVGEFAQKLRTISPKLRYVNNKNIRTIQTIAFCAGSGSEFIEKTCTDCFVTGDLKYNNICETRKVVFDIGHFESEVFIKEKLQKILEIKGIMADEKTPFI